MIQQFDESTQHDVENARLWMKDFDHPVSVRCDPETGAWVGQAGFNVSSSFGARGVMVRVESIRESDVVLGLYLIFKESETE